MADLEKPPSNEQNAGDGGISVKLLYFATVREMVGKREELILLSEDDNPSSEPEITTQTLRRVLSIKYPKASSLIQSITLAVNMEYCEDQPKILANGDEVALIPPISGG